MKEFQFSEKQLQKLFYDHQQRFCTSYELIVPNCYTSHENECDLFAIRSSGLTDEVEIKISRSDFLADRKKVRTIRLPLVEGEWSRQYQKISKHECLEQGHMSNYYWYLVKEGIATEDEVPSWAGFAVVSEEGRIKVIRRPKRLHTGKVTDKQKCKYAYKLYYRYWQK